MASYELTLKPYIIYLMRIPDAAHQGCVKVGKAELDTLYTPVPEPKSSILNKAAHERIREYTRTASIYYELKYTEAAYSIDGKGFHAFDDKTVHDILERSGIIRHDFNYDNQGREWFECSDETAIAAIKAAKEGRHCLSLEDIVPQQEVIDFRPEQKEAIEKTVNKFHSGRVMLWNAKMRFGKTLCALEVVKRCQFHRTLILTHRPVVDEQWFKDYKKLFHDGDGYNYGSRSQGESFEWLEGQASFIDWAHYIYFASIQDLRGAELAGGKFDKNQEIFRTQWDCLIVDEAHEGTQTELGQNVLALLTKPTTKTLSLSGTPFNLLDDYKEDEIFTWDYVDEQRAKAKWDLEHFGDHNPYAELPRLNIFTFELGKALSGFEDVEDAAFNFKEFFRTWTGDPERDHREMPEGAEGKFVHEEYVRSFLDMIVKYDPESNYPFSTPEFRANFRHSLWMVPGVREAKALSDLLRTHPIFTKFEVANVAGPGDDDVPYDDAMALVRNAMGNNPEESYSITLSCGKLTTGVTVRPWTAVMMLAGSHNTDAKAYMQTIFRVQSPYTTPSGQVKKECYVFDFAPDRTLKVLADTAKVQTKKTASDSERTRLGEFLNFCPVIGYNGTQMAKYNVESMLEQLKRAYISRVTRNGCDDDRLYNQEMLRKLNAEELAKFQGLHKIIGSTKANHTSTDVDISKAGLTNEQYAEMERIQKKAKKDRTPEELAALEEAKKKKQNADAAISILRGISIRLPLLMYGAELSNDGQDVTLENFASLIDDQSWAEFMPRGVTKEIFADFVPYYDPDMFRAVSRNYRDLVREADKLAPLERTREIAHIFSFFRNPDKETVLTPWRVVNMHIGDCIGGQVFFENDMQTEGLQPRFVNRGDVTDKVFKDPNTRILEINSKTGLYPLFMAYSVFAEKLRAYREEHMSPTEVSPEIQNTIWDKVLQDNIFVVCKTEMARSITKRTLRGFRESKVNARHFQDLINKITNQPELFISKVNNSRKGWNNYEIEENMKFNAIVGNPPYQTMTGEGKKGSQATPIYNAFIFIAKRINPDYISMITPARWYTGGMGLNSFRTDMLNDRRIRAYFDYPNPKDCFPNTNISGGVSYFLWDSHYNGNCLFTNIVNNECITAERQLNEFDIFIRYNKALSIIHKVKSDASLSSIISPIMPFGLESFVRGSANKQHPDDVLLHSSQDRTFIKRSEIKQGLDLLDKYNVLIGQLISGHIGETDDKGQVKVLATVKEINPGEACTASYLCAGAFNTIKEAQNLRGYLSTKFVRFLLLQTLSSMHITKGSFMFVPIQDFTKEWTDSVLYKKYNLSPSEIDYIESMIKPMDADTLFESEDLIDPKLGDFDLLEHGVKVGDHILYTPSGTEVVVAENNMVEYDGELYTLSRFTAKFMPRNKRSISGVCQGPRYFSFNGISLYKMKESFLGGKK